MRLQWNPLLDSSNMDIEGKINYLMPIFLFIIYQDWIRIATEIELNYTFDAFVILHGTDTMAYTSSALSFLLEDLGKTVVCPHASKFQMCIEILYVGLKRFLPGPKSLSLS